MFRHCSSSRLHNVVPLSTPHALTSIILLLKSEWYGVLIVFNWIDYDGLGTPTFDTRSLYFGGEVPARYALYLSSRRFNSTKYRIQIQAVFIRRYE